MENSGYTTLYEEKSEDANRAHRAGFRGASRENSLFQAGSLIGAGGMLSKMGQKAVSDFRFRRPPGCFSRVNLYIAQLYIETPGRMRGGGEERVKGNLRRVGRSREARVRPYTEIFGLGSIQGEGWITFGATSLLFPAGPAGGLAFPRNRPRVGSRRPSGWRISCASFPRWP